MWVVENPSALNVAYLAQQVMQRCVNMMRKWVNFFHFFSYLIIYLGRMLQNPKCWNYKHIPPYLAIN
jgi:hypothetical protein